MTGSRAPTFSDLADVISTFVRDGQSIALEGFTHLIPFGAAHEIIRQERRNLTLIRMTPDIIYEQMIGMGCADRLVFSWGGNPGVGSLHRFRDAVEHHWPNKPELDEHGHRSEEHTPEIPSLMRKPCSVFLLKKN